RRRHHDHERIAVASVAAAPLFVGGENVRRDPTLVNGVLYLSRLILGRELAKLLGCAHLRRKLTGAIFAGKTARLTREGVRSPSYVLGLAREPLPGACSGSAT